MYQLLLIKMRC